MSVAMSNICRICLASLTNKKYYNVYITPGRTQQISTKMMACAWVQVFDGDGLPNHICCKCHDTLELAYQFKQMCESSDAQLRQFFGRNIPNKTSTLDLAQESRDCYADLKPTHFNMNGERLDLPQCDISLNTLRLLNQDMAFASNFQLGLTETVCDTKEEPGYHTAFNAVLAEPRPDQCPLLKSSSCVDSDSLLSTFQAKLLEAVSESLSNGIQMELNDNKLVAWDLQNKQPVMPISEKNMTEIVTINQKVNEDVNREAETFLDKTRCVLSPDKTIIENVEHTPEKIIATKEYLQKETPRVAHVEKSNAKSEEDESTKNIKDISTPVSKSSKTKKIGEQCELCGKVFRYRGYLQVHMRTHTDERPHVCTICRQTFTMQHVLVAHMRTHSGDRPYVCYECGKGFSQSSGLKSHMRSHSGEKPYQCEICSMKFAQSSNLKSHKVIHTGRRDYICKICNMAFKFVKHLHSHQKKHYNNKEFKCPLCPKSFIRKRYRDSHVELHRGVRAHRCAECGHAFATASNLRTHARVHSGDKPFACQICKKCFTQSSTLKRHMKQHRMLSVTQPAES